MNRVAQYDMNMSVWEIMQSVHYNLQDTLKEEEKKNIK